jgi:hypothetical protein
MGTRFDISGATDPVAHCRSLGDLYLHRSRPLMSAATGWNDLLPTSRGQIPENWEADDAVAQVPIFTRRTSCRENSNIRDKDMRHKKPGHGGASQGCRRFYNLRDSESRKRRGATRDIKNSVSPFQNAGLNEDDARLLLRQSMRTCGQ